LSRLRPALRALSLRRGAGAGAGASAQDSPRDHKDSPRDHKDSPRDHEESRRDQDEAQAAVKSGAIRPLEDIVAGLRVRMPGEIVKIKLEREHGLWVYEFRVLDPRGRLREVTVNASTGAVMDAGDD
jgi:hypothetical protein